jgi:arginase family enzyme
MPCTGTPVENGLKKDVAIKILEFIFSNAYVYNFDISELNLELGDEFQRETSKETILDILRGIRIIP